MTMAAQVAEIESFPQGKAAAKTYEPQFIGSDGQQVWMIEMTGRMKNKPELVCYTMDQKETGRVRLTDDKETKCYGGYLNNGKVDLLMAQWEGENMKVYRDRRDAATLQSVGETLVLADYKGTKGDQMAFAIGMSANKELLAGVYIIGREGQGVELQVGLYNRELEEYWKMDARCRKLDFIHVTDSGEVLIGGYVSGKYAVSVLDGEDEDQYSFEMADKMNEMALARYAKGKIYFVGAHSAREKYELQPMVDYVASICYDTKSREVAVERHTINKVEYNRLNNFKDDAKVKKDDYRVVFFSLNQVMPVEDGCYAMFDQTWRVTVDGVPSTRNRLGMMVARIDNDGKFEWVKTFRISNVCKWTDKEHAGYRWEKTAKGLMLLWSETKSKKEIPEDAPVKDYSVSSSSGMLTAALIDRNGDIVRQHFEIPSKQSLLGHPFRLDNGDFLLIIRGVSRGYYAKMKMQ